MIIDCISDLHGYQPDLPGGDLLILAGDYTAKDTIIEWAEFFCWLKLQNYRKKILIAGNHDNFLFNGFPKSEKEAKELQEVQSFLIDQNEEIQNEFEYLCDSGIEFEGLKIWGSPWSLIFDGVSPKSTAFMDIEDKIIEKFNLIPSDTDILITHTPPYGILDYIKDYDRYCGSCSLRNITLSKERIINLKLNVFGHIHECGNSSFQTNFCWFANASYVNRYYKPVHTFIRFIYENGIIENV